MPLLNFELAAYLATFGELVFPVFLIAGFGTRFFAMALTAVNIIAVVSYYATLAKGAGLVWHYLWGSMLLTSVIYGGGFFSIDQWLKARFGQQLNCFPNSDLEDSSEHRTIKPRRIRLQAV